MDAMASQAHFGPIDEINCCHNISGNRRYVELCMMVVWSVLGSADATEHCDCREGERAKIASCEILTKNLGL